MASDSGESQKSMITGLRDDVARQSRALKISEEKFERLIGEVEDYAIIILETDGTIVSWNKGAETIKGYAANEIIGKSFKLFYSKDDRDAKLPDRLLGDAARLGKARHEGWRIRKDGTRFWGSVVITAIHNNHGEVSGYLKVTRDLTERKIAEDNFSNYAEELKQKNDELKRSEDRYHKMISEVTDYAIILLDKDGRIVEWNKGAEKVKGYRHDEIIGKSFRFFYTKEDKDAGVPEKILNEARTRGSVSFEGWRIRKDGSRFWGSISITALHNDAGEIIGFSKVTRDLTEKKIAEDRLSNIAEELRQNNEYLRQSEERYHRMIAEVEDYAIILLNKHGDIENWNAGAQKIKGYTADEIVGKNFRLFYPKEDRNAGLPERILNEAEKNGKAVHEGWRVRKDGTRFWGSIVITALHDSQHHIIGFSKVTRDLTDKKNQEENLRANAAQLDLKNKVLERLNQELSSFAFIASHDLKEPLRKIQMYSSRLEQMEEIPEKAREYIERIQRGTVRMQDLIDDLLAYSQVSDDAGKDTSIDLNEVLAEAKSDLEISLNEKQAIIESDQLPIVEGIAFQFQQVFFNLIGNALKFVKQGERPYIKIRYHVLDGPDIPSSLPGSGNKYHQISITDNGIGFEPQFADKIFDIFHRLHSKERFTGTGIGLAIVKKVVENHHGVVVAEGIPGEGATFNIYLPFSQKK